MYSLIHGSVSTEHAELFGLCQLNLAIKAESLPHWMAGL